MSNDRVTIADVAERAGVSAATVGRVVGGYGSVSNKTRDKILSAIDELGYTPNVVAQGLRSRRTKTIAVVIGSISNSFFANMVNAIENEAEEYGYNVIICNTHEDPEQEMKQIVNLQTRMIDGIILSSSWPVGDFDKERSSVYYSGVPIVMVDRRVEGLDFDVIESENFVGSYKTTNYLIALGHRKIGILGAGNYSTVNDRIAGYREALTERKIEFLPKRVLVPMRKKNRYNSAEINNYFLSNQDMTAVMILNNSLAETALLRLEGLPDSIRDRLSIICWDDAGMNKLLGLTTVLQFPSEMGREAARRVIGLIEKRDLAGEKKNIIGTELIIRSSCKPL